MTAAKRRLRVDAARRTLRRMAAAMQQPPITLHLNGIIGESIRPDAIEARLARNQFSPVTIRLDSTGGIVADAVEIYRMLRAHLAPVSVIVTGDCKSAATLLLLAADYRSSKRWARFLLHQPAFGAHAKPERWTASILRSGALALEAASDTMAQIIEDRTDIPTSRVRKMLAAETRLTAHEAADLGLIHFVE